MKTIKLREPFYGAGSPKQYNWVKDGYHVWGIGIKIEDLRMNKEMMIEMDGNMYLINTDPILEFIKKYNSLYWIKKADVTLGVFSKSLLPTFKGKE